MFVAHHIVADLWSLEVLHEELRRQYSGDAAGSPAALARHAADYADFVRWEHDMLAGPEGERLAQCTGRISWPAFRPFWSCPPIVRGRRSRPTRRRLAR